jgi:hypothetical protein
MNNSIFGVPLFKPRESGVAASIENDGIGAAGNAATGSAATDELESAFLSSLAPLEGFSPALALSKKVEVRKTASAAVAIVFALNLIVVS